MKSSKITLWLLLIATSLSCYIITPYNANATVVVPTYADVMGLGDGGLISQEPCGPPCYQGITLGMSVKDAASVIQAAGLARVCEINPTNITCGPIRSFIDFDPANTTVNLVYYYANNITAADVINKYGNPNWYEVEFVVDESGNSTEDYFMKLYYDELKMIVELEPQSQSSYYILTPETKVVVVNYQEVWWQDDFLPHDWHGYGKY